MKHCKKKRGESVGVMTSETCVSILQYIIRKDRVAKYKLCSTLHTWLKRKSSVPFVEVLRTKHFYHAKFLE